jgi:predicted nucleic acid-binding protein
MEQPEYLVDTNAVIDYLGKKLPAAGMIFMNGVINGSPKVSVVSKIEVLGFNAPAEHYQLLVNFMNDVTILDLTNEIVEKTIEVRKKYKTKLPDAIIAATAVVHKLVLISRNTTDFKNTEGIQVIDAHGI